MDLKPGIGECTLEVPIYPKLVRTFYEITRICTEAIFELTIKDTLNVIDERRNILEMSMIGICVMALKKKIDGLRVILERDDIKDLKNLLANQLSTEMRLLHNMVSRIFFLKMRRFY